MFDPSMSPVVTLTLWLLLLFSAVAWTIIAVKGQLQWRLAKLNRAFVDAFWRTPGLREAAAFAAQAEGPLARLAQSGFQTLRDLDQGGTPRFGASGDRREILEMGLRQQIQNEQHRLESGLAVLASIGSTAPFVGLFGTVWGIMHALEGISASGSAALDVVAGPIGEALIATAIGIATAVPAVLAYNYGLRRLRLYITEMEDFATRFVRVSVNVREA
jgi:biopolymer transport protein ExbB